MLRDWPNSVAQTATNSISVPLAIVCFMSTRLTCDEASALRDLREALVWGRPGPLSPQQGDEAFQGHKLLAAAIHQSASLGARGSESETRAWIRYFQEHFPPGRNGDAEAELLWKQWRTAMLKIGAPGPRVLVTHGQAHAHWQRDTNDRLVVDLESMWSDFEWSVDHFITSLRGDIARREVALKRRAKQRWEVEMVSFASMDATSLPVSGATAVGSATRGPQSS
jgi:hypothetical protein